MPEFTQSWAFWFLVVVISFAVGFALAIKLTASAISFRISNKKREKMEDSIKFEIATQGKPEDD